MAAATPAIGDSPPGTAGVVVMRGLLLAGLLVWAMAAQAGGTWSSLWRTADQRGEQLMRQGNPAAAARVYSDPRRKAYAELLAGDYLHAARDFAAFDDSNGNYNRGNALARAGQLQEAIKAYDAALARDPKNRDARHNRDLVARALQKQPPQSKPSSGNNSSSGGNKNGNKGQADSKKDAGKQDSAAKNPSSSGGSKNGNKEQADSKKDAGKQDTAAKNPSSQNPSANGQQNRTGQGKDRGGSTDQKTGQGQPQLAQANHPSPVGQASGQPQPADASTQAQRDAAAGLDKLPAGHKATPSDTAVSEQQLAQEQWLRRIPDDPGGLLQRKFMIEHMIRQQGTKP
ncbi:MAG: tetratricopeptide repeat protein [Sulfuricella sp.]